MWLPIFSFNLKGRDVYIFDNETYYLYIYNHRERN